MSVDWIGSILALLGSFLLATNTKISSYGFVAFLASNLVLAVYFWETKQWSLWFMQLGFTISSLLGIYRWRQGMPILSSASLSRDRFTHSWDER